MGTAGARVASARKRSARAGPPPGRRLFTKTVARPAVGSSADHQDRVVAGDGPEDVVETCPVERGGEELRGPRRRAQQGEVGRGVRGSEQLAQQPGARALGGGGT